MKSALSSKEIRQTIPGVMSLKRLGQSSSATDLRSLVFGPADDATSNSRPRVAGWLRLQIVRFRVHDNRPPDCRLLVICQRDLVVHILQFCLAGSVRLHISHVAHMPLGCVRRGMRFVGWIKMSAGGTRIGRAAIAEFMNVKAMVTGSQACYLCMDLHAIGNFGEGNRAAHLAASSYGMKHRNRF